MRLPAIARRVLVATLALAPLALAPACLAAQATPATPATPAAAATTPAAERAAVLAVVTGLFDAMRAGDSTRVRALFHPGALLGTAMLREGRGEFRADSVSAFAKAVGTPHAEVWDERLYDTRVELDGPLASVWTEYSFFAGTRFSHCGTDAFQLVRTAAGWRIVALVDTRRRTGCRDQPATPARPTAPTSTAPAVAVPARP